MNKMIIFYCVIGMSFLLFISFNSVDLYKEHKFRSMISENEDLIKSYIKKSNSGFKKYYKNSEIIQDEITITLTDKFDDISYKEQYKIIKDFDTKYNIFLKENNIKNIFKSRDIPFDYIVPTLIKYSTNTYDYSYSLNGMYVTNNSTYQAVYDKNGEVSISNDDILKSEQLQECEQGTRDGSQARLSCMEAYKREWSIEDNKRY